MEREQAPSGQCPGCGGALIWSKVSGRPQGRNGDGSVVVAWIGRDPICAASLVGSTHPCRPSDQPDPEPIAARADGDLAVA